jgi:hypothetical protein
MDNRNSDHHATRSKNGPGHAVRVTKGAETPAGSGAKVIVFEDGTAGPSGGTPNSGSFPVHLKDQYEKFYPLAVALPRDQVQSLNALPALVLRNLEIGVDAVRTELDRVRTELPAVDVDALLELPAIGGGLAYSSALIVTPVSRQEIAARLARMLPIRREAINAADTLVRRGMLPGDLVKAVKQSVGRIAIALHTVALANLFLEHWEQIHQDQGLTREEIEQLRVDAEYLVRNLTPKGGRKPRSAPAPVTPTQVRDRFYSVIVQRHEQLRRVATYLWGTDADAHVPKLTSRLVGSRAPATATGDAAVAKDPQPAAPTAAAPLPTA